MMQDREGLRGLAIWPRRNGKDLVSLNILIAKAIQRSGLYLYVGPYYTQTRQIIWAGATDSGRKFLDYIPPNLIEAKHESRLEVTLKNGSLIKLAGSDRYDTLMGLNAVGIVFTEYSLQRPEAWDLIRPMVAANGGWALFNGTPRGLNHLHAMAKMAEVNPKWFYQYLTCEDTGHPTKEQIQEEREAGMRESMVQQEFYCSWVASSEEVFIPLDFIAPCMEKEAELQEKDYEHEPRVFGVDVAYALKGDKAAIAYRQGRKLHFVRWYRGMDNTAFANEIARLAKAIKPHTINIDAGRGEGVISRLEDVLRIPNINPVHFGGKVYEEGIANMKAKMWVQMAEWFSNANMPDLTGLDENKYANQPVAEDLARELSTPFMELNEKNEIKVESKKSLKSRGERSPDLAEAVGLTFAVDVEAEDIVPQDRYGRPVYQELPKYDYLDYMDSYMNPKPIPQVFNPYTRTWEEGVAA